MVSMSYSKGAALELDATRAGPLWTQEDGQWLRRERLTRGLTQKELGEVIGRTGGRISEFERGHTSSGPTAPSRTQLKTIKDFFARTPVVAE